MAKLRVMAIFFLGQEMFINFYELNYSFDKYLPKQIEEVRGIYILPWLSEQLINSLL